MYQIFIICLSVVGYIGCLLGLNMMTTAAKNLSNCHLSSRETRVITLGKAAR